MKQLVILPLLIVMSLFKPLQNQVITVLPLDKFIALTKDKDVQLIDVRTPEEFKQGHIINAKNIDFFSQNFDVQFENLDKSKPVYIYCRSGNRSGKAAIKLAKKGFVKILDLEGGYLNYSKNNH